ncbi:DUF6173 family protein [Pectobacterium polaris]|uniref:DUF6173 family protein n=1 Tax=Pectobacterium polaris TaxID=2042057 RepID=UPI0032E44074
MDLFKNPQKYIQSPSYLSYIDELGKEAEERQFSVTGNFANQFYQNLLVWINEFHKNLSDEYEVGAQLVSFGQSVTFTFSSISYRDPSLISFSGLREDGSPIELIQHVSQINILLIKVKRSQPEEPKRPIGFAEWPEYDNFKNQD